MNALLSNLSIIQASSSFPELSAGTIAEAVTWGTFFGGSCAMSLRCEGSPANNGASRCLGDGPRDRQVFVT